jgi:hypothetical protein
LGREWVCYGGCVDLGEWFCGDGFGEDGRKLLWKLNGENWVLFAGLIDGLIGDVRIWFR